MKAPGCASRSSLLVTRPSKKVKFNVSLLSEDLFNQMQRIPRGRGWHGTSPGTISLA